MARFGRLPVQVPESVKVEVSGTQLKVTGPKGVLEKTMPNEIAVKQEGQNIAVEIKRNSKNALALQGTTRSHLVNMVKGVTEGWNKSLELVGTGYRAELRGNDLLLTVGYSHPVTIKAQKDIKFTVDKAIVKVEGSDKDLVGQIAAYVRTVRKADPYKGKGFKYVGEILRKKAGKQAAKTTA